MRVHLLFAVGLISLGLCQRGDSQTPPPAAPQKAEPKRRFVVYSVADLVNNYPATMRPGNEKKGQTISELLCDLITQTIAPATWEKAGGTGKLEFFSSGMAIGVNQTQDVHEEITAMLRALRRLQEVQVAVQVQLLSVPEATFDKVVDVDWIANHRAGSFANERLAFLNDAERKELLTSLHKDKRTETLVSPSLRMHNGQRATIDATEEMFFLTEVAMKKIDGIVVPAPKNERKEIGFKAKVQATVSGDRRYVQIDLDATRTALESSNIPLVPVQFPPPAFADGDGKQKQPQVMQMFLQQPSIATNTVAQKFNVPDGGTTVIVVGKERRETRQGVTPPLAAIVPFGQELFSSVTLSRESHMIVMLVTPRIVINEEIEREILGLDTPTKSRDDLTRTKRGYYFTGGLLKAKQFAVPVDYDLTVVEAVALALGPLVNGGFSTDPDLEKKASESSEFFAARQILVLRREKDGPTQRIIDVDRAMNNPAENLVVRDGDVLILQEIPTGSPKTAAKGNRSDSVQVYYTGGIDSPRQHLLPRGGELKVTQAIAGKLTRLGPDDPMPSEVLVIRRSKSGEQTQIRVSLNRALLDPSHDAIVQNGDFLVLQESPADALARLTRGIGRDVANIRSAPGDLSEPSEPRQSTPRR